MTDIDPEIAHTETRRLRVQRQRNVAMALVLGALAILFFAITIVKLKV